MFGQLVAVLGLLAEVEPAYQQLLKSAAARAKADEVPPSLSHSPSLGLSVGETRDAIEQAKRARFKGQLQARANRLDSLLQVEEHARDQLNGRADDLMNSLQAKGNPNRTPIKAKKVFL